MPQSQLTTEILTAALEGFEAQKKRLDEQIAELRSMMSGESKTHAIKVPPKKGKRTMSAGARQAIAEAQKKRWAEWRKKKGPVATPAPAEKKPKKRLSAAARKAIGDAARKRWAAVRAAKQAAVKKPAAKKPAPKPAKTKAAKKGAKTPAPAAEAAAAV